MNKNLLGRRLRDAIGAEISGCKMTTFYTAFSEHAHYLARCNGIDEKLIRPRAQLRLAEEFTDEETWLFCLYCGYDLREDKPRPLW